MFVNAAADYEDSARQRLAALVGLERRHGCDALSRASGEEGLHSDAGGLLLFHRPQGPLFWLRGAAQQSAGLSFNLAVHFKIKKRRSYCGAGHLQIADQLILCNRCRAKPR